MGKDLKEILSSGKNDFDRGDDYQKKFAVLRVDIDESDADEKREARVNGAENLRQTAKELEKKESRKKAETRKSTGEKAHAPSAESVVISEGTLLIYQGKGGQVVIPRTVKAIGWRAFYSHKTLRKIVIPKSVESIGADAFNHCSALQKVKLHNGLRSIEWRAFAECKAIRKAVIPKTAESIGEEAFLDCSSLKTAVIRKGVKSIESGTFMNCTSLARLSLPDTVESIGTKAFFGCASLKNAVIPQGVKSIGALAFLGCKGLKKAVVPESTESLGYGVFSGCSALREIVVKNGNPAFKTEDGNLYTADGKVLMAYACGKDENRFVVQHGVERIEKYAFTWSNVSEVVVPMGVKSIGDWAFYGCDNLKTIVIPEGVAVLGERVFSWCKSLSAVVLPCDIKSVKHNAFSRSYNIKCVIGSARSVGLLDSALREKTFFKFIERFKKGLVSDEEVGIWKKTVTDNTVACFRAMKNDVDFYRFVLDKHWLDKNDVNTILSFTDSIQCRGLISAFRDTADLV